MTAELNIVFEDDALLVIDKPAGLLMHPSWLDRRETDTLASRVKTYFAQQGLPETKVHTIHRLDRPTSGLVVIAKQDDAAKKLAEQFASNEIQKTYHAICRGFCPEHGTIDHALKEEHDKIADKFAEADKPAQAAVTQFKRLGICEMAQPVSRYSKARFSLVEVTPKTGRKHQIRRHFKHLRHPLLGDSRHGCRYNNQVWQDEFGFNGLALRAVALAFQHPMSGDALQLTVSANEDWQRWLAWFGWERL